MGRMFPIMSTPLPAVPSWEAVAASVTHQSKLNVLVQTLARIAEKEALSPELAKTIEENIRAEYSDFHSGEPLPEGSQHWRETRSARLLYSGTVKIDAAYYKRAERHVQETLHFFAMCGEVESYLKRKAAPKQAKIHA